MRRGACTEAARSSDAPCLFVYRTRMADSLYQLAFVPSEQVDAAILETATVMSQQATR
jgi:hypothetical protein